MTRDEVLNTLKPLEPALKRLGFSKLYLFGSVARDEPETNDVDLLYEEAETKPDFFQLSAALDELEKVLGRRVDLVSRQRLHHRIRSRVEAELVEIY